MFLAVPIGFVVLAALGFQPKQVVVPAIAKPPFKQIITIFNPIVTKRVGCIPYGTLNRSVVLVFDSRRKNILSRN